MVSGQTLEAPAAPGDITINLTSTNPAVAYPTVSTFTIPAGIQSMSFTVNTAAVTATSYATIKATANRITKSQLLTVSP